MTTPPTQTYGTYKEVYSGKALKTSGRGLLKKDLTLNPKKKVVSKARREIGLKMYKEKKGIFSKEAIINRIQRDQELLKRF